MDHSFPQIDRANLFRSVPVRNPLLEVRWWAFLRGDAYVNPFHDLLYALSRQSLTGESLGGGSHKRIRFTEDKIVLDTDRKAKTVIAYADLLTFQLDYQTLVPGGPEAYSSNQSRYVTCYFRSEEKYHRVHFAVRQQAYVRLLDDLYRHRVVFRELVNGIRSFKTATYLPYRRIQELKKEFGIEW
ncbi:hypothetical protein [Lewinella sp. IMCC34191]|uniref:hypothetical protein n=1 Tax=Lewinella sp. IMCC34191 TaxID=2259172 RepID=UPI000E23E03A|nr:hypothetical protein [Lewinella sp. IMCC34191]